MAPQIRGCGWCSGDPGDGSPSETLPGCAQSTERLTGAARAADLTDTATSVLVQALTNMTWFFLEVALLVGSVWHGVRQDTQFRALAILLLSLLVSGTIFYHLIEQWSVLDSLYFCVMTISTVGYGDLTPTGPLSKAFTICFAILGIGLFASFVAKLVVLGLDLHSKAKERRHGKHGK